jgi:hypothetical protein
MREFRACHPWLFWPGVLLAAWGLLVASCWLVFMPLGLRFSGLSPDQVAEYDLRPFPVGGGLRGQLRFWWCLPAAGALVWLLAAVVLGTAPWFASSGAGSGSVWERKCRALWLACAAAAGTGGLAIWGLQRACLSGGRVFPIASLAGVERLADLRFPAGARLVEARGHGGWKGALRATVVMPKATVRPFLLAPPFDGELSSSERPHWADWYGFPSMPNWAPGDVEQFTAASGSKWDGGDSSSWWALADVSDPETATVYLEWTRG